MDIYMTMPDEKSNPVKAAKWFNSRSWAGSLKLNAHKSTDVLEFWFQYSKNPQRWEKAFKFLDDPGIADLNPGRYPVDGKNVYASVADEATKDQEDTRWEAHQRYIDIQYVVRGKEKIGVAPRSKAISITAFDTDKDVGFFEVPEADCQYYTAEPGTFFIFFPQDAHRPCIKIKGTETDKKIVIKIKID